jgi:histone deacetylase 1/2
LEKKVPNEIPYNDYYEYFAPDFLLHLTPEPRENENTAAGLAKVREDLMMQLQNLQGAPSVQMQEVPPSFVISNESVGREGDNDGGQDDNRRDRGNGSTSKGQGERRRHEAEFYSNENDVD